MTRRDRLVLIVVTGMLFLLVLLPLSVVLAAALPARAGVVASRASGSIWNGQLDQASVAGLALGDTRVALSPLPLLIGRMRLGFRAPALAGVMIAGSGSTGFDALTGTLDVGARIAPLPISALTFEDAHVRFRAGRCTDASGSVRATVTGSVGGLSLPGGLSGVLGCNGDAVSIPLVGQSGMERIDMRVTAEGKWHADVLVRTSDPALATKLGASGFVQGSNGYVLRITGAL